jgi:CDP-glucose 4,6-dehydratase
MDISYWSGRNVLITGATGFVGGWLTYSLLDWGANVHVLIRDPNFQAPFILHKRSRAVTYVQSELESYRGVERAIVDNVIQTIFHLGAHTIVPSALENPLQTFEANIRGTYHVLEACRNHPSLVESLVIASSDKAYGEVPHLPYTEEMASSAVHPYDVSKACADMLAQSYWKTYRTPIVIARCGNIYGGGDLNWSRIIPGTIRSYLHKCRPILRSDGSALRDYVYIEDVVAAYMRLAEIAASADVFGEIFNFGPGKPLTVLEVVEAIRRVMDIDALEPDIQATAKSEIQSQYLDSSKARSVLGWRPTYTFDSGLAETIKWYSKYFELEAR